MDLSIVVCTYNMERELPRTLKTLARDYQKGCDDLRYEVIIVDNGSTKAVDPKWYDDLGCEVQCISKPPGNPSPVRALNEGLKLARGKFIGLMIDGARMLSPGVFELAMAAGRMRENAIICTHGFHLGPDVQSRSVLKGYNQQVEDGLLESVPWQEDGYRLLEISVFAGSSYRGWFVNPTESNCLIMSRENWANCGYLDERFATPGGGLVNLDIFSRACELEQSELVLLIGEGTFHQIHGGAATGQSAEVSLPAAASTA